MRIDKLLPIEAYYCMKLLQSQCDSPSTIYSFQKIIEERYNTGSAFNFLKYLVTKRCLLFDHQNKNKRYYVLDCEALISLFENSIFIKDLTWKKFFIDMGLELPEYVVVNEKY